MKKRIKNKRKAIELALEMSLTNVRQREDAERKKMLSLTTGRCLTATEQRRPHS